MSQQPPPLHVVLHQPEIPQNTGNIGRTCVAVGAKLWLVRPMGFRLDESRLRRAGLDYWQHLDWQDAADWSDLQRRLPARKWLFTTKAERLYTDARFEAGDALVFGSESGGLPDSVLGERAERCLRIPMRAEARSLNLASAAAAAVFEAIRQLQG